MMKKILLLVLLSACAQMPSDQVKEIESIDQSQVVMGDPVAVRAALPVVGKVSDKRLNIEFTKADKLMLVKGKRTPVKHVELEVSKYPNLVVYGVHKGAWKKDSGVFPALAFFKDGKSIPIPKIKKIHYDGMCAMHACRVVTYDLKSLKPGMYNMLIAAYVEDPNRPAEMRMVEGTTAAGGTFINQRSNREQYATYFGEVMLETSID